MLYQSPLVFLLFSAVALLTLFGVARWYIRTGRALDSSSPEKAPAKRRLLESARTELIVSVIAIILFAAILFYAALYDMNPHKG